MDENKLWWGYKHVSGTYQAKRYFGPEDISETHESPFVWQVVYPFEADSREEALEYIKNQTK